MKVGIIGLFIMNWSERFYLLNIIRSYIMNWLWLRSHSTHRATVLSITVSYTRLMQMNRHRLIYYYNRIVNTGVVCLLDA